LAIVVIIQLQELHLSMDLERLFFTFLFSAVWHWPADASFTTPTSKAISPQLTIAVIVQLRHPYQ
jgi:hypothetical protein